MLEYVKKRGRLPTAEARNIFKQIVYGLGHIHARSVIHRDMKLDNIFLDDQNNPKIGDFGVSKLISKLEKMDEQCGTPAYLAPEIIRNQACSPGYYPRDTLASIPISGVSASCFTQSSAPLSPTKPTTSLTSAASSKTASSPSLVDWSRVLWGGGDKG